VIIPKKEATLATNGLTKSLLVADFPSGISAERILWVITPLRVPGWSILFKCTHSKKMTIQHLVLKLLLQRINYNEKTVLLQLLIDLPEPEYEIIELILSNQDKVSKLRSEILTQLAFHNFLEIENPHRQFASFEPEITIFKVFTDRAKLAPERYIGVGYNDHGSLSSGPSWKEQQTTDGDDRPRLGVLLYSLRKIFETDLSRTTLLRGSRPADERQKARNRFGRK
jgi:hypothetical protein